MAVTTTDKYGRPRDQQRSRVYEAEGAIRRGVMAQSKIAQRLLVTEARLIKQRGAWAGSECSIEDCQRYVDDLVRTAWVQRRWGRHTVQVNWKASGSATCAFYGGDIALPPWSRQEAVILHEMAHHFTPSGRASHGPEFAGIYLALVRHRMGKAAGDALKASYRKHRVRFTMADVPAPTRPVVTAAARAERAASREQALTYLSHRRKAAEVIRRLATRPMPLFGPSGSKPRTYAMATARALKGADKVAALLPTNLTDEHLTAAAASIRACVKADLLGKVGTKPRARALAVARALDTEAPRYKGVGLRNMVYAATPQRW